MVFVRGAFGEGAGGEGLPLRTAVGVAVDDQGIAGLLAQTDRGSALYDGLEVAYAHVVVVRTGVGTASPPAEERDVEGDAFALGSLFGFAEAGAVVVGGERFARGQGGIKRHLDGRLRGQLQRKAAFCNIGSRLGRNLEAFVCERVATVLSEQVDVARGGRGSNEDVVIGQQHGFEVDDALSGRKVDRVDSTLVVDGVDHRTDRALGVVVGERIFELRALGSALLVVRGARRQRECADSNDGEQHAQGIEFFHVLGDLDRPGRPELFSIRAIVREYDGGEFRAPTER